jgi:acyl-CoA thioester hydrolase
MKTFEKEIQVRWSDIDPNFHVRHSAYYDWGALLRVDYFVSHGLTIEMMNEHQIGPILFREEAIFKREILMKDTVKMDIKLTKARRDYTRWSIRHTITKNNDTIAAIINVDGSWINSIKRKLAEPNPLFEKAFTHAALADDFEWLD